MIKTFARWIHREKSPVLSFYDARSYFAEEGMPSSLIYELAWLVEGIAHENGESTIGTKTIQQLTRFDWQLSETELRDTYIGSHAWIEHYVQLWLSDPDMPTWAELTARIADYSDEAKKAYIFLTESTARMVYSLLYESKGDRRTRQIQNGAYTISAMNMCPEPAPPIKTEVAYESVI